MFASVFIIAVSLALFVYWFRCTVLLILRTRTTTEYASKVAAANQLSFVQARQQLGGPSPSPDLSGVCRSLQHDYGVLKYLLGHAATVEGGGYTAEQRLLMMNFRMLAVVFWVASRIRPDAARMALLEMSGVLEYFANVMGQRFAGQPARS